MTREQMHDRVLQASRRRRALLVRVLRALERGDMALEQRTQLAAEIRQETDE